MKKLGSVLSTLLIGMLAPSASAAHTHLPPNSTWKLNEARSDFGGGPSMADQFTVVTDTDSWFAYTEVVTDSTGKVSKFAWSGPHDGTLRAVEGLPDTMVGFNVADNTAHMESPNSFLRVTIELSADGRTRTEHAIVRLKNGKVYHETWVYDRIQ
ncbi:MAG TPA: hypothetical protein VMD97_01335 [Candidatus Aquilonibacter sp.]|nr:hypothetical protein [Candidatus Aquilonibacter sp.]